MRRPAVFVFLTAAALALAGCGGGGSSSWSPAARTDDGTDTPTPGRTTSGLASCLEGTWELDEAVLTTLFQAGFVESLAGAETEGMEAEITSLTASQTVTFADDETFTSATQMDGGIAFTYQGQTIAADMTIEAWASGTWTVDDDELAVTALDGGGTMTMQAAGQTQTDDLGDAGDIVMLPTTLEPVTCRGNTLTIDGAGLSTFVPDAPEDIVFARQ